MAVVSDFTKTPHQILLRLLNESNAATNLALAESAVTFDDVIRDLGAVAEVTVTAASGSGYRGSVDVTYIRVDLGFKLSPMTFANGMKESRTALHITVGQAF